MPLRAAKGSQPPEKTPQLLWNLESANNSIKMKNLERNHRCILLKKRIFFTEYGGGGYRDASVTVRAPSRNETSCCQGPTALVH